MATGVVAVAIARIAAPRRKAMPIAQILLAAATITIVASGSLIIVGEAAEQAD
jgi:hypothetical protein